MPESGEAPTVEAARSAGYLFRGQLLHAGAAVVLGAVAWALAAPALDGSSWLGVTDVAWFWACVGVSVVHQLYTWLAFRGQLGWGVFTRWFGEYDLAVHGVVFLPLLVARPAVILGLGLADPGTLALPQWLELALGVGLLIPALYTGWSIRRHFGLERALGGDHFRASIRELPFVAEGAFGWTPNAMYTPSSGCGASRCCSARTRPWPPRCFQHAFVWAHYLGTEQPDMELIYGQ